MLRWNAGLGALALAAALGLGAQAASSNYKGSFNLPFETYWGGTVLEPGEYTVTIDNSQPGVSLLRVSGNGKTATVFAGPVEHKQISDNGRVVLVEVNGIHALKEFEAGSLGRVYSFSVPKEIRTASARASMPAATTKIVVH